MRLSINTNIESINNINPLIPLSEEQLIDIYNINNLIKNVPELATDKLYDAIASIVFQQIQSMISGELTFQNYIFSIADASLGVKNAL